MDFDFINDIRFKELLLRDYNELKLSYQNKLTKSVLVLSGSIIEACLIEYFLQNTPTGYTESSLLKLSLSDLIDLGEKEGLLSVTAKNLASVIKDYRNLIHPGRQIRKNEKYDFETATVANTLVTIVLGAIKNKIQETSAFSASEIIDKLRKDTNFRSIFGQVILRLNQNEKHKLFDLLLKYEIKELDTWNEFEVYHGLTTFDDDYIENIKPLIADLKPLIQTAFIQDKLSELVKEIQTGEKVRSYALFNLIHEDIDKLPKQEQEMIAIYFLAMFEKILEKSNSIARDKTFSTIGKYLKTRNGFNAFKKFSFFCFYHFDKENINSQMNIFEQALNSLQEDWKIEIIQNLRDYISKQGLLPLDIVNGFLKGVSQRGIIKL